MTKEVAYKIGVLCFSFLICCGCTEAADKFSDENNIISVSENTEQALSGIEIEKTIYINEAAAKLDEKIKASDNVHLSCEKVEFHNVGSERRCYYIFRYYNDFPDHRATVGWYAVDVETGECFDTHVLTEWTPLE